MKINSQLVLDDGEQNLSISLPSESLAILAGQLADNPTHAGIFNYLSRHSDSTVRAAIAQKKFLPRTAVARLVDDPVIDVISELLSIYGGATARLSAAEILTICRRDSSLAGKVAANCDDFACDDAVYEFLATHLDDSVRAKLVSAFRAPKVVLQLMAQNDSDSGVREAASKALDR